jgi:hypothetical protein
MASKLLSWASRIIVALSCLTISSDTDRETRSQSDWAQHDKASRYIMWSNLNEVASGSGVMVSPTLGLSAAHVCTDQFPVFNYPGFYLLVGYDTFGDSFFLDVIVLDLDNDICVFKSTPASLYWMDVSSDMPEPTEDVHTVAYPMGVYSDGLSLKFKGTYGGCIEKDAIFAMPATHGSSGAGILNEGEQVVSIVSRVTEGFQEITIGCTVDSIHDALEYAKLFPNGLVVISEGEATIYSDNSER